MVDAREELRLPPPCRWTTRLSSRSSPESDGGTARHRCLHTPRPLETPPARCTLMTLLRRRACSPPRCTQLPACPQL